MQKPFLWGTPSSTHINAPNNLKGIFIKWTTSGEPPVGSKSHWHSYFWSNKQKLSDHNCLRPCMLGPISSVLFSDSYCERPCKMFIPPAQFIMSLEAEDEALASEYCYCDDVLPICDRSPFRFKSGTNRSYRELPFRTV